MFTRIKKTKLYILHILGIISCVALLAISNAAIAQNNENKQTNPIGGGSGWNAEVQKADPNTGEVKLDEESLKFVQSISDYFNRVPFMQGEFRQTNHDNQVATGRFYLKRPGRLRFDYTPPSAMRVVSDGNYLSIEDHDLRNADQYPLDSTPFQLLIKDKVDFLKDAKLIDVTIGDDLAVITVADKEEEGSGQLKLFFSLPDIQLQQWIITDPQGLDTRIELSNHVLDQEKDDKFFEVAKFDLEMQ